MSLNLPKILIVDDDSTFTEAVAISLRRQADVQTAFSLAEARQKFHANSLVDVVITDFRMNSEDGHAVLAYARKIRPDIPIILVTAYAAKDMAVRSVNLRVFSLLEKPVDFYVLSETVKRASEQAISQRQISSSANEVHVGSFILTPSDFSVTYEGKPIRLTGTEFQILHALVCAEGKRLSRGEIVGLVWGSADMSPNLFDTHLMNLRKKIPALNSQLRTVRGKGYVFTSNEGV